MDVLEFRYGSEESVDSDVDAFKDFYLAHFRNEALERMMFRVRKRNLLACSALCLVGVLSAVPMIINAESIFAKIILVMGIALFVLGLVFLIFAVRAGSFCSRSFDRLMDAEFAASRSMTKRVFNVRFAEGEITVSFGATSAVKQVRTKRYSQISAVYATDELVFIKGLTWLSRFQMSDGLFDAVCAFLKDKCPDRYHAY